MDSKLVMTIQCFMVKENLLGFSQCLLLTIIGVVIVDSELFMTIQCFMVTENLLSSSQYLLLTIIGVVIVGSKLRFSQLYSDHCSNALYRTCLLPVEVYG